MSWSLTKKRFQWPTSLFRDTFVNALRPTVWDTLNEYVSNKQNENLPSSVHRVSKNTTGYFIKIMPRQLVASNFAILQKIEKTADENYVLT